LRPINFVMCTGRCWNQAGDNYRQDAHTPGEIRSKVVISYLKIRYFPLKSGVRRADITHKFYADRRITS
jgi:hypothetical protein